MYKIRHLILKAFIFLLFEEEKKTKRERFG